jgi:N-formylglutamate deformylase
MNEQLIRPNGDFEQVQAALRGVIKEAVVIGQGRVPLAAE